MKSRNIILVTTLAIVISLSALAIDIEIEADDGSCFIIRTSETGNTAQLFTCKAESVDAKELCGNGEDDDLDGLTDCADEDCEHSCKKEAEKTSSVYESAIANLKETQKAAKSEKDPERKVEKLHAVKEAAENVRAAAEKKEKEVVKHEKEAIDKRGVAAVSDNDHFVVSKNEYAKITKEAEALIKSVGRDIDTTVGVETKIVGEDCTNNIDDDGDGKIDCADLDCNGLSGANYAQSTVCEFGKELSCNDKFDNDRDSRVAKSSLGKIDVAGKAVRAVDVYDTVSHEHLGSRGVKVTKENLQEVEDAVEVDDIHLLDPCAIIDCYFVAVEDNLALISTPESMWTVNTNDDSVMLTTDGIVTDQQVENAVDNNKIEVTNDVGEDVNINNVAKQVSLMSVSMFPGNSITSNVVVNVGGTDCADSDCFDNPVCQTAVETEEVTLLALGKECGSHEECASGLCAPNPRYDEIKVCTAVELLANGKLCKNHGECASGICGYPDDDSEWKVCTGVEEETEPAAITCDDPDVDNPLVEKTTVTLSTDLSGIDKCLDENTLVEYHCVQGDDKLHFTNPDCPTGTICSDGACVEVIEPTETAADCIAGDFDRTITDCSAECDGGTQTLSYTKNNLDCKGDVPEPVVMKCNLDPCTVEPTVTVLGDVNGDGVVNLGDAIAIAKHDLGVKSLSEEELANADVDCSDAVNLGDAILIAQVDLGIPGKQINACS